MAASYGIARKEKTAPVGVHPFDFDLSNEAYLPIVTKLNNDILARGGGEKEMAVIQAFMGVSTPNFISTLDLIDREYGGMTHYLQEILCITHDDIQILRKRYLL